MVFMPARVAAIGTAGMQNVLAKLLNMGYRVAKALNDLTVKQQSKYGSRTDLAVRSPSKESQRQSSTERVNTCIVMFIHAPSRQTGSYGQSQFCESSAAVRHPCI